MDKNVYFDILNNYNNCDRFLVNTTLQFITANGLIIIINKPYVHYLLFSSIKLLYFLINNSWFDDNFLYFFINESLISDII